MQGTKQEDPEFWCQTYSRNKDNQKPRQQTSWKVPRSRSHSPSRCPPNSNLNLTRQTDSPRSTSYQSAVSPLTENSAGCKHRQSLATEDQMKQEDSKREMCSSDQQKTQDNTTNEKRPHASLKKRKKKKGKSQSNDCATTQFIKKMEAGHNQISEKNSCGHFSSCSDLEASDNVDRSEENPHSESSKATPVMACNIKHESGGMTGQHVCCSLSSGTCGLVPRLTHNAYVLHWLQHQTSQAHTQPFGRNMPNVQNSPCHWSHQAPSAISSYPVHSSPVHQSQPYRVGCTCPSGHQDVSSELMSMIQQGNLHAHCLQPSGDFQPVSHHNHHQAPIAPDAQSFLAMLQHKPEMQNNPCSYQPADPSSMKEMCHYFHPCVDQTRNSPQRTACPPFIDPQYVPCTQHRSPCRLHQPPNNSPCSLEQGTEFLLHQPQKSPVCFNTSSLNASHGSPRRPALSNTTTQNSPANSYHQVFEDSVLSAMSSICTSSADRNKGDDKAVGNPPPIGVFWDIENCAVPRGKSALAVVQSIRDKFFTGHREAEFLCVCDINKENATVIQELNDAQVTVAHINATAKNAADDKLKQSLRRFADTHNPPATVVLISGDINFARDLSDLRHRNNLRVILVHRDEASEALIASANETVRYQELVNGLPFRSPAKTSTESNTLIVRNLPCNKDAAQLRSRLKQLSDNCGGKVLQMGHKNAVIQFPNAEKANRAKIRLDGENVFGKKISVASPKQKVYFHNASSLVRGSLNKLSPQSVEDTGEEAVESHSDSKGEEESEHSDNDKGAEDPEDDKAHEERFLVLAVEHGSGVINSPRNSYQTSLSKQHCSSTDSPQSECIEDPSTVNASAKRIAAAFRPLQQNNMMHTQQQASDNQRPSSDEHKPVIEIWPKRDFRDTATLTSNHDAPSPVAPSAKTSSSAPEMNWPTLFKQHITHPVNLRRPKFTGETRPDVLPFKPIPTVQRIPTPLFGQTMWNRTNHEQMIQSPTLRGVYRPPSPMLANPMGDWQYMSIQDTDSNSRKGAELLVTNLDNKMSRQDLKQCLLAKLSDHCKVLHLILGSPVPGRYQAVVRVPSIPDAIRAMAHINRCQIGSRLIHVTLLLPSESNADKLRLMMIPMLQEIPGMCLPLSDITTSFERRYRQALYVGDLYHIPDTITVRDTAMGKVVALTTQSRPSTPNSSGMSSPAGYQSPAPFIIHKEPTPEPCEPYCSIHDHQDTLEYRNVTQDPFVVMPLRTFSAQVHTLLQMHNGRLPLISFMVCYAAEFSMLTEDHDGGVPLEHLLTCIQGVRVGVSRDGYKTVCWEQSKLHTENPNESRSATPLLPPQLFQFSKEAVELLKHTPGCRLAFSKFIPSYHHHFGRQCRVADYGFQKLIELFDSVSHVLQVLGMTENKLLTLTHRAQIKRFSQDLLKMLKSQASKQMTLVEFPLAYQRCFNRPWKVGDYGVCDIQDILTEVPENIAMISWNGDDTVIFIPKREQTKEELIRMRKFSREVVELLSHQPRYRILFSKFIPSFHHHFGRQCRVGDYGFNKLLELFEALQDVIQVEEQGDERVVRLATNEQLALIARHSSEILQRNHLHLINLDVFHQIYGKYYMYPVCLKDFDVKNMEDLMARFPHVVEIVSDGSEKRLHLVEKMHLSQLAQQVLVVLLESDEGYLPMDNIKEAYQNVWHQDLIPVEYGHSRLISLMKMLHYVLTVQNEWMDNPYIELTPVHQFARKARSVLIADKRFSMTLQELVTKYHRLHGVELQPADYGHTTLTSLIETVPRVLSTVSKGPKRAVTLNPSCLGSKPSLLSCPSHTSEEPARSQSAPLVPDKGLSDLDDKGVAASFSVQSVAILSTTEASSISPDLTCVVDSASAPIANARLSSGTLSEISEGREECPTPSDCEGRTLTTPSDDSKTPRRAAHRYRGRCQLAANFSAKGTF